MLAEGEPAYLSNMSYYNTLGLSDAAGCDLGQKALTWNSPTPDTGVDAVWLNLAILGTFCAFPTFLDAGLWKGLLTTSVNPGFSFGLL